jgi:hypothetical protein
VSERATSLELTVDDVLTAAGQLYSDKIVRLAPLPNKTEQEVYTVAIKEKGLPRNAIASAIHVEWQEKARGTLQELYNWLRAGKA